MAYFTAETWKGLAPEVSVKCNVDMNRKVTKTTISSMTHQATTVPSEARLLLRIKFNWLMQVNKINTGQ